MTASSFTDRRDADDAVFAAEVARLDGLEVADVAADVREQADALLSRTRAHMAWRGSRGGSLLSEDFAFLAGWDAARTAMFAALKPAPGTDTPDEYAGHVGSCPGFTTERQPTLDEIRASLRTTSGADQPTLRDQLAEVLTSAGLSRKGARELADALLPLIEAREAALRDMLGAAQRQIDVHKQAADEHQARVERAKAEAAAEALEGLARDWRKQGYRDGKAFADDLDHRAAALRSNAGGDGG